jgi:hypothetical protein
VIYCDNQSCIKLSENPVFHDRSKNIEIQYHFIRDYVQRGAVELQYISTIDDFRGEISPMGEIKGPLIFYWTNFLY